MGMVILLVGVGGFLVWAGSAPLNEGIPAIGTLNVESKRKTISHLTGGIVKSILVKEAQLVEPDVPLIILDDTIIRSDHESALQTFYALKAAESRLLAEQTDAREIHFPDELTTQPQHPLAVQHMATQRSLFRARRAAIASQVAVLNETAAKSEAEAKGYQEQLRFVKEQWTGIRELVKEGYAPRKDQLELQRQMAELTRNIGHAHRTAAEARLQAIQARSTYRQELETSLADTRRDAENARNKVIALRKALDHTVIRSSVRGYVTGLEIHTVGGVITPGMKLMDIVPVSEKLIFEVHAPSQLIDKVRNGLLADINLHNFPDQPHLVIEGRVISYSADLLSDPNPELPPYFLVRVEVTPAGKKRLGKNQLQSGMQADVVIKTGERTLLTYLLKPLFRRLDASFKEI